MVSEQRTESHSKAFDPAERHASEKTWCVTVRQSIIIGNRRKAESVDRRYTVRAKTARAASRAIRNAGHTGQIVDVSEE